MTTNEQNAHTSLFSVVTLLSRMHGMNNIQIFLSPKSPDQLRPTQSPMKYRGSFPVVKRPQRYVNHSPPP